MVDITHITKDIASRKLFLGITFEQFVLIFQGSALVIVGTLWLLNLRRRKFSTSVPPGCVRLGLAGQSHSKDEFDAKYSSGTTDKSKWRVKSLFIHPIKSCAGIEVDEADVDASGMIYDRKFVFAEWRQATSANSEGEKPFGWMFRTLRNPKYEKLAQVKSEVWVPKNQKDGLSSLQVEQQGRLIVKFPNVPSGFLAFLDQFMIDRGLVPKESSFSLPLIPRKDHRYPVERLTLFDDQPNWINMGEHVPHDFKLWLGVENTIAIFRADPENLRQVHGNAPKKNELGWQVQVGAPDSYPLSLQNIASIQRVSEKVQELSQLSVRRFRPNILLEGPQAFDEDDWKRIKIGGHDIICSCRTLRCKVTELLSSDLC